MSYSHYDNLNLNEIINNLQSPNGEKSNSNSINGAPLKPTRETVAPAIKLNTVKFAGNNENDTSIYSNSMETNSKTEKESKDVKVLLKELDDVKNELAILKRSQSLTGHSIFSKNPNNDIFVNTMDNNKSSNFLKLDLNDSQDTLVKNSSQINLSAKPNNISSYRFNSMTRLNNTPSYSINRPNYDTWKDDPPFLTVDRKRVNEIDFSRDSSRFSETSSLCTSRNFEFCDFEDRLRAVRLSKIHWLKMDYSRDACRKLLAKKDPGYFVIRIQSEYANRMGGVIFELLLRVEFSNSYYSIEQYSLKEFTETSQKGIKMIGYASERMFGSLEEFVASHLENPGGLPLCLKLPTSTQENHQTLSRKISNISSKKLSAPVNFLSKKLSGSSNSLTSNRSQMSIMKYAESSQEYIATQMIYLGKFKIDRISGQYAIKLGVDKALWNYNTPKRCLDISLHVDSLDGITLIDNERQLFYKKVIPMHSIIYSGLDPLHRGLRGEEIEVMGMKYSRIFGVVCQKKKMFLKEHKVHLFAEKDRKDSIEKILSFLAKYTKTNYF